MRLFFAVEIPDDFRAKILVAQTRLAASLPPKGFRLVKPGMLHVTLAFLGDVAETALPELKRLAEELCASASASDLVFEGIGCFPAWKHPRVLWIGVEEAGFQPFAQEAPLARLGLQLAAACMHLSGHKPEDRVLLHVTLARSGEKLTKAQMREVGERVAAETWTGFGETKADTVVLYESTLGHAGPVEHRPIARFPLKS